MASVRRGMMYALKTIRYSNTQIALYLGERTYDTQWRKLSRAHGDRPGQSETGGCSAGAGGGGGEGSVSI